MASDPSPDEDEAERTYSGELVLLVLFALIVAVVAGLFLSYRALY